MTPEDLAALLAEETPEAKAQLLALAYPLAHEVLAHRAHVAALAAVAALRRGPSESADLHRDALRLLADKNDALRAERDRLTRILAVEKGDQSAAPEGWRGERNAWSTADDFFVHRVEAGRWEWVAVPRRSLGVAGSALEAMEAADAALAVSP